MCISMFILLTIWDMNSQELEFVDHLSSFFFFSALAVTILIILFLCDFQCQQGKKKKNALMSFRTGSPPLKKKKSFEKAETGGM